MGHRRKSSNPQVVRDVRFPAARPDARSRGGDNLGRRHVLRRQSLLFGITATDTAAGLSSAEQQFVLSLTAISYPDLTVVASHSGNFSQGQTGVVLTVTVTNSGSAPTSGTVTMADALPTGFTATAISGSGWTCSLATVSCQQSGALSAGGSYNPTPSPLPSEALPTIPSIPPWFRAAAKSILPTINRTTRSSYSRNRCSP